MTKQHKKQVSSFIARLKAAGANVFEVDHTPREDDTIYSSPRDLELPENGFTKKMKKYYDDTKNIPHCSDEDEERHDTEQ